MCFFVVSGIDMYLFGVAREHNLAQDDERTYYTYVRPRI